MLFTAYLRFAGGAGVLVESKPMSSTLSTARLPLLLIRKLFRCGMLLGIKLPAFCVKTTFEFKIKLGVLNANWLITYMGSWRVMELDPVKFRLRVVDWKLPPKF